MGIILIFLFVMVSGHLLLGVMTWFAVRKWG